MRTPRVALALALLAAGASVAALRASAHMGEVMNTTVLPWSGLRPQESAGGMTRQYFDAPTSTLLQLGLRARTLNPGATPHPTVPNSTSREQILLVKDGVIELKLGDKAAQQLDAGSAVFLAPNQVYSVRNPGSTPATYYEINWTSPGMSGERQF
jgi:mannose-6-phosphate isomerase-like protein (cupin superfamily)